VRILIPSLFLAALLLGGCDAPKSPEAQQSPAPAPTAANTTPQLEVRPVSARPNPRKERPLPAFSGWTLEDKRLSVSSLLGKRLLLFFFNPEVKSVNSAATGVAAIASLRHSHNFEIVGVVVGSSRERASAFVREHKIEFQVIDDSSGAISKRLGLRSPVSLLGVDGEGYIVFGFGQLPDDPRTVEEQLRLVLRLPVAPGGEGIAAGDNARHPTAPLFDVSVLDRDTRFSLAEHAGRPVVLIFFLHTCPHCHEALKTLKSILEGLPADKRPAVVGIEVSGRTGPVRAMVREFELEFMTVSFDIDAKVRELYGIHGGVPEIFLIDAEGKIADTVQGWRDADVPLMRMRIAKLVETKVPMLLRKRGYSGNEVCGVCHEEEADTWQFTHHAQAFNTLVKHGADRDPECVSCHVIGYDLPGGYTIASPKPDLEDVGCEACHGRGGPHLSEDFVVEDDYAPICATCHDSKHSLGFDYATFGPAVSHAENAHLLTLPAEERRKLLAERGRPGGDLLARAGYVGSEACESCHSSEFETWSKSAHARSLASLTTKKKAGDADCLRCHTTAMGLSGGFADSGDLVSFAAEHEDLARVGCESCHGPGADHIGEDSARFGTILSLGDNRKASGYQRGLLPTRRIPPHRPRSPSARQDELMASVGGVPPSANDEARGLLGAARALIEELHEEGVDHFDALPPSASAPEAASDPVTAEPAPTSALEEVRSLLGDCTRCGLSQGRKNLVFGDGNPNADLMFVGEGPGQTEDEQGLPFVGRAGELLTKMIEKGIGVPRGDVYICNRCDPTQGDRRTRQTRDEPSPRPRRPDHPRARQLVRVPRHSPHADAPPRLRTAPVHRRSTPPGLGRPEGRPRPQPRVGWQAGFARRYPARHASEARSAA